MPRYRCSSATHFEGDLFPSQSLEDPQFDNSAKGGIDSGKPVQGIIDFDQRMFLSGLLARQLRQLGFDNTLRQRTRMMNQQLLHQVGRQSEEGSLLIGRSIGAGRAKSLDPDQLKIELMNHSGGLQGVIRALGPHTRGGDPPQLGVKEFDQAARRIMIAIAKARHQPRY